MVTIQPTESEREGRSSVDTVKTTRVFSCAERGCDFVPTPFYALAAFHRDEFGHALMVETRDVFVPESPEVLAERMLRRMDTRGIGREQVREIVGVLADSLAETLRRIG